MPTRAHLRAAALLLLLTLTASGCLCGSGGTVCVVNVGTATFEQQFLGNPAAALVDWIRQHYTRMIVHAPAFDSRLSWYPRGWFYKNTYAIYPESSLVTQHPEWILRDAGGHALYIPWGCAGGTCPQYAGDVGNPAFRADWIAQAGASMAAGYQGIYLDDFNMRLQIGNGSGQLVAPVNPRTGRTMTDAEWRRSMADFATEIRQAFPHAELVQNQVYFFASAADPDVVRATRQASHVFIERAFNDGGLVGGSGRYGFETLLAFIDAIHAVGVGTVEEIQTASGREYALACYFLTSTGNDGLANPNTGWPTTWWSANEIDLGKPAAGGHYRKSGLFRRDFAGGLVLVNQPGAAPATVVLDGSYQRVDGSVVTQVTIGAAEGVVLRRSS